MYKLSFYQKIICIDILRAILNDCYSYAALPRDEILTWLLTTHNDLINPGSLLNTFDLDVFKERLDNYCRNLTKEHASLEKIDTYICLVIADTISTSFDKPQVEIPLPKPLQVEVPETITLPNTPAKVSLNEKFVFTDADDEII